MWFRKPKPNKRLNKAELAGLLALQQAIPRAQQEFAAAVASVGLDPAKAYSLRADGAVIEVVSDGGQQ